MRSEDKVDELVVVDGDVALAEFVRWHVPKKKFQLLNEYHNPLPLANI